MLGVVAIQLAENLLTLAVAVALFRSGPGRGVPVGLADVLAFVTGLKWLAVALVLLGLGRKLFSADGEEWRNRIRRVAGALVIHRFSLLPVVPIAALVLPSGPNIADQVPDVQRRWLDGWIGLAHGTAATVALLVLTLVVFVVGRLRCDWVWRRRSDTHVPHRPKATLWLWLVGPGMVVALAFVAWMSGGGVLWDRVFFGVPLVLVAVISYWLRRTRPPMIPSTTRSYPQRSVLTAIRAGDALAVFVVVIGGLGLDRAFIAPAFLYPTGDRIRSWLLLALSAVAVAVPWLVEDLVRRRLDLTARSEVAPSTLAGPTLRYFAQSTTPGIGTIGRGRVGEARLSIRRLRRLLVILSLGTFGLLGVAPVAAARTLGVVACLILALMAVTTIASTMLVITQEHAPPEALRLIIPNLRTTPIVTFLLGTVVFAASIGQSSHLHDLRGLADSPQAAGRSMPARPALVAAADVGTTASIGNGAAAVRRRRSRPGSPTRPPAGAPSTWRPRAARGRSSCARWSCSPPMAAGSGRHSGRRPRCRSCPPPATAAATPRRCSPAAPAAGRSGSRWRPTRRHRSPTSPPCPARPPSAPVRSGSRCGTSSSPRPASGYRCSSPTTSSNATFLPPPAGRRRTSAGPTAGPGWIGPP